MPSCEGCFVETATSGVPRTRLVAVGIAVSVRSLLAPTLGGQLPLVGSFGAVAWAAWSGDVGPSIAAAITGILARSLLRMERQLGHRVRLPDPIFDVDRIRRGRLQRKRERVALASVIELPGTRIEPERLASIFDLFSTSRRGPEGQGLGIGLALSKCLIELHGGPITAESEGPGKASRFVVTLPRLEARSPGPDVRQRETEPMEEGIASPEESGKGWRILIVDDNEDGAISLALWLRLKGHETCVAHDGLEALRKAERFRPGIVLLDIGLPELDGYDVCRRLRSEPWGRDMRVFALTGWGQAEAKDATTAAGFDAHLVKPVEHSLLEAMIAEPR